MCAAAGDLTRDPAPLFSATRRLAAEWHALCRGGTWCDCQHQVPSVEVLAARRAASGRHGFARILAGF
jgi:hypothetical protein